MQRTVNGSYNIFCKSTADNILEFLHISGHDWYRRETIYRSSDLYYSVFDIPEFPFKESFRKKCKEKKEKKLKVNYIENLGIRYT